MGINRVQTFWNAVSDLSYAEMRDVADEIAHFIPDYEEVRGLTVADAMRDALEDYPRTETRGGV